MTPRTLMCCRMRSYESVKKERMLFQEATLPERFQRWITYVLRLRKASKGLWPGLPCLVGLYPFCAPSCFPYRRSTVESKVSQSSRIVFQGMSVDRYAHTWAENMSAIFTVFNLPNIRVSVVAASGSLPTPKSCARISLFPRYMRWENLSAPAKTMAIKATVFAYIPMPFGERSSMGIAFSIIPAKPIFSKNKAIRAKPP